jgi:N utilization substance protein A
MTNVLEALGIDVADVLDPTVLLGTISQVSADAARMTFADGTQAMMPISEFYPQRTWHVGEKYHVLTFERDGRRMASTVLPELVEALYAGPVPEIRHGVVRVMSVARAAGERTKIAVALTTEGTIDPVAAMIGREANRVTLVREALDGERVDVIAWHADPAVYLANALAPARVTSVEIDENVATVYAPAHQMSAAVGHGGLNSQLAGQLLGLSVTVVADTSS